MANRGQTVYWRCPECGHVGVEDAGIPGIKAYKCTACDYMALLDGFKRVVDRDAGGNRKAHG